MKRSLALLCMLMLLLSLLTGCSGGKDQLSASDPVTLTMWHVYGSQTESPLNELIAHRGQGEGRGRLHGLCVQFYRHRCGAYCLRQR